MILLFPNFKATPYIVRLYCLSSYEEQANRISSELRDSAGRLKGVDPMSSVMKSFYSILQAERSSFDKELENLPDFKPGRTGMHTSGTIFLKALTDISC